MEFFVPGLLFFILTVIFTFYVAPKATPMIAAVLSLLFLTYGVYDHYRMFASEYRLSTWQEPILQYSPAIMIVAIILYVIYGMVTLFTKGQVPVPAVPSVQNAMNGVTDSLSYAANSIAHTANYITNAVTNQNNQNASNASNASNDKNNKNNKNNKSNLSRSFVESV